MWHKFKQIAQTQTVKDSAASFIGHNFGAVIGAVFFAISFRILGADNFGIASLSLATSTILKDISGPAINATLLRLVPQQKNSQTAQGYIHYAAKLLTHFYLVLAAIALLLYHYLSLLIFKQSSLTLIAITVITSVSYSVSFLVSGILHTQKKFTHEAIFTFSASAVRLCLLISIYFLGQINVITFLLTNLLGYIIVSSLGLFYIGLKFLKAPVTAKIKSTTHKFLLPMGVSTTVGTVTNKLNLYLTNYFASLAQVGLLGAVMRLFIPVQQFSGVVSSVFGSRFSNFPDAKSAHKYLLKTTAATAALSLGLLSTIIFAKPIGLLIYGADFAAAIPVFRILLVAFSFFVFQTPFSAYLLYYKGRSDIAAQITTSHLILSAVINLVLIPNYGIFGAAWAMLITLVINTILTVGFSLRVNKATP